MKSTPQRFLRAAPLVAAALFTSVQIHAQTAASEARSSQESEVLTLDKFSVTSQRERGYGARTAPTALRVNVPLTDIPVNINVMSADFIQDMNESDINNQMTWNASFSGGRNLVIRGFNSGGLFLDGHRFSNLFYPSAMIDRVEIVKGPSSTFVQRTSPGGTVNYVRKKPLLGQDFGKLKIGFGETNGNLRSHYGGDLNFSRGNMAFRMVATYAEFEDTGMPSFFHTALKHGGSRYKFLFPSLTFRLSDKTDVTFGVVKADYQIRSQDPRHSARGIVLQEGASQTPISVKYGLDPFEDFGYGRRFNNDQTDIFMNVSHIFSPELSGHIQINNHERLAAHKDLSSLVALIPATLRNGAPNTAQRPAVRETWLRSREGHDVLDGSVFVNYQPRALANRHTFTAGYSFNEDDIRNRQWTARVPGTLTVYTRDTYFLDEPIPRSAPRLDEYSMVEQSYNWRKTTFHSLNGNWHGSFMDGRLNLMAAISHTKVDDTFQAIGTALSQQPNSSGQVTVTVTPTPGPVRVVKNTTTNPMLGALYKLNPSLAVFAMGSTSMEISNLVDGFGRGFGPVYAKGYEGGVKITLPGDRIFGTLAYYHVANTDAVVFDPTADNAAYQASVASGTPNPALLGANSQSGELTAKGFEADIQLNLTKNWLGNISYALNDTRFTKHPNPALRNTQPASQIKHSLAYYNKYRFTTGALEGLSLGAGIVMRSGELDVGVGGGPRFRIPGFRTLDVTAQYEFKHGERYASHIMLTVRNLLEAKNSNYGYNAATVSRYAFANPRTIWLDYTLKF